MHHTGPTTSKVSTEPRDIALHFSSPVPGVPAVGLCLPRTRRAPLVDTRVGFPSLFGFHVTVSLKDIWSV